MATTIQPQIRVKSYFATCVTDAMELARREMGPDALWLDSRPSPPEARHLGPLEVVFGETPESIKAQSMKTQTLKSFKNSKDDPPMGFAAVAELGDLRQSMEEIRTLLIRVATSTSCGGSRTRPIERALVDAGLTRSLADELDDAVCLRIRTTLEKDVSRLRGIHDFDPDLVLRATREEMNLRIETKPGLGKTTALVGPPGSGKTSALVKLAVREGLMKGRSVRLISADTHRIAAVEQLRIYAAILGVPFQCAESLSALAQAVDSAHSGSLLLIDTPGLSPAMLEGPGADLAAFFRHRQDIDVHVVLTASMSREDLEKASTRFAIFRPAASIFTRLDETDSLATLFCEVVRGRIPVSYLCDGQIVPEDIEPADKDRITESLVRRLPGVLRSAAA